MKNIIAVVLIIFSVGCASSYQDRLDALNNPEDVPVQDKTPPEDASGNGDTTWENEIQLTGSCIVNADCDNDKYCELGICVFECGPDVPCAEGLYCSARGKCVSDSSYIDVNSVIKVAPPVDWQIDKGIVRLNTGEDSASFTVKVNGGGALQYRVQIEPREALEYATVSESEGAIASGGEKEFHVGIDRAVLGDGDHRISVNVISDGGQRNVICEFSNGFAGRYGGFISYTNPTLGMVPVVIDLKSGSEGNILGRIVSHGSLLFPVERTIRGQYNAANNSIFLSAADLMEPNGDYDPFERPISREIYIFGNLNEQRIIKGEIEEVISGLLPQSFLISGEIYITRISSDLDSIADNGDPIAYGFPEITTSYKEDDGIFSNLFDPDSDPNDPNRQPITCNDELNFNSNMINCSRALRNEAFKLGSAFSGVNLQGDPVVDFGLVEECRKDVASSGTNACVNLSALDTLRNDQQNYLVKVIAQDSEYEQYFEDLKNVQRLYSFMGNDLLVDAYRTTIETVSSPLTTEISRLENALDQYEKAERAFFEATNIYLLSRAGQQAKSISDYELFRVPLQYVEAAESVVKRIASLEVRLNAGKMDKKDELRRRIQNHARVIFFEGLALANLIKSSGGSFVSEMAQVADELRSIAETSTTLEASLNPLGFADDYVPFIYDPLDSVRPTNFSQLMDMASVTVEGSLEKARIANSATELMQMKTEEIKQKIEEIIQSFDSQIEQICGVGSFELLSQCGIAGGEMALAINEMEQQSIEIEKIHQQIMDLNEMVKIKRDSALRIMQSKAKSLNFTQTSGAQLEATDMAEAEVKANMLRNQSSFWGSLKSFVSGAVSLGVGIYTGGFVKDSILAGISGAGGGLGDVLGGIGGIMGGSAANAQSADEAIMYGENAMKRQHIQDLRQMRFQEEGMEIAAIEAAEQVKLLIMNMAQLNLDMDLADKRLAQSAIRTVNLIERVRFMKNQRDVLLTQVLESVNNPLSNLSFRLKRDHAVLIASNDFEKALSDVYLAARGLEHELNTELPQIASQLFQTNNAEQLADFMNCLKGWYDDFRIAFGSPHEEVSQISLREDILGFKEQVTDRVTGEVIQPGELFRRVLLNPKNITRTGRVEFPFVTSILGSEKNFSTLVCNDRVRSIRVKLVGDFLGDNEATVMLRQEGNSYIRDCSSDPAAGNDILNTYHLDQRNALIQAGVNSFGLAPANHELTGRSVASDRWVLIIPTGSEAPNNRDMDLLNIDDVVIEVTHEARTLNSRVSASVFGQCNI